MSWARLDDAFPWHPKVIGLSDAALALWTRARCWVNSQRTGGVIPASALWALSRAPRPRQVAAELVEAGLWEAVGETAWSIHDYDDYEPAGQAAPVATEAASGRMPTTDTRRETIRRKRAEAGRLGADRRWEERRQAMANADRDGKPMANRDVPDGKPMATADAEHGTLPCATELPGSRSQEDPDPIPELLGTVERGSEDVLAMRAHGKRARSDGPRDGIADGKTDGTRPLPGDGKPWPPPAREPRPGPASAEDILAWTGQHQCLVALIRDAAAAWEWAHDVEGSLAAAGARAEDARDAIAEFVAQYGTAARGWSREEVQRRLGGFLKRARDVGAQGRTRRERAAGGGRAPAMPPTPPSERLWKESVPATANLTEADVQEAMRQCGMV